MEEVEVKQEAVSQVEAQAPETQTEVVSETVSEAAPAVEVKEEAPVVVGTAPETAPVVEVAPVEVAVEVPAVHPGHGIIDEIEAKLAALGVRVGSEVRGDFAEIISKLRKVL